MKRAFAVLAGILILIYLPFLFGQREFFILDSNHFFEPLCGFIGESLRAGRFPLWNPYSYCGMSQAAISSPSIFFPLNWLFAILPFSQALAVIMVISQLVCAAGTFLLVRSFGWGNTASAIAAAAVSLSGYMFSLVGNYTLVASAAWVPPLIYCSRQCIKQGGALWVVANAFVMFMLITAGRPEVGAPGLVLAGAGAAIEVRKQCTAAVPRLKEAALSWLAGLLLSMPVILPCSEWLLLSRRLSGLDAGETLMFSANWYTWLCMLVPAPLGNSEILYSPFVALVARTEAIPYFQSAFVGTVVVSLALLGLSKRGGLAYWAAVLALCVTAFLSLGKSFAPAAWVLMHLPGASIFRFPSKLLFFPVLMLSLFAARGAWLVSKNQVRLLPHIIFWCVVALALAVMCCLNQLVMPFAIDSPAALPGQKTIFFKSLASAIIACATITVLAAARKYGKTDTGLLLVAGAALVQLLAYGWSAFASSAPAGYYDKVSPLIRATNIATGANANTRILDAYFEALPVPPGLVDRDRLATTVRYYQYERQMLKSLSNVDQKVPSSSGIEASLVGEYYHTLLYCFFRSSQPQLSVYSAARTDLPLYRFLQTTSTSQVMTRATHTIPGGARVEFPLLDPNYFQPVLADAHHNVRVYQLKQPLPRAYLTFNWRRFTNRAHLLEYIDRSEVSGFDPANQTLLEEYIGEPPKVEQKITPVSIDQPTPERLVINVTAATPALLVLQDQYYPGWEATLDSQPVKILRCNGFMRAVSIPPGNHRVVFSFRPLSVLAGLICAALGLLMLTWFAMRQRFSTAVGRK